MKYEVRSNEERDFGTEMLRALSELESTAGVQLSPFQKILLAEIATVEQVLSIIAGSAITVAPEKQQLAEDGVLSRRVTLQDSNGRGLLVAETNANTSLLPPDILDDLLKGRGGIGTILRRYAIETIRRIEHIGYDSDAGLLYRRYLIIHHGQTWFSIHEEFSDQLFR